MKKRFVLLVFLLTAVVIFSACGGTEPEPTPEPQVEAPVVQEPQLSPMEACAQNITLPGDPAYPLLYCEDFSNADAVLMPLGEYESKPIDMTLSVYNGKYTMRATVKRDTYSYITAPGLDVRDFIVQVEGRMASHSGHPYHTWGIVIKQDPEGENYYYFAVDNNQYYYFMLVRGEKETNLINGRLTKDINPLNEGNTLTVVGTGDTYEFYINGNYMEDFKDNRILNGNLGLFFDFGGDTLLDWEFDNFVVYAPQ